MGGQTAWQMDANSTQMAKKAIQSLLLP